MIWLGRRSLKCQRIWSWSSFEYDFLARALHLLQQIICLQTLQSALTQTGTLEVSIYCPGDHLLHPKHDLEISSLLVKPLSVSGVHSRDFFTFFRHALMSGTIGALVSDHTPSPLWKVMNHSFSCCILYLFVLQLKAVFLNFVFFHLDEHFQVNRLLIKYSGSQLTELYYNQCLKSHKSLDL